MFCGFVNAGSDWYGVKQWTTGDEWTLHLATLVIYVECFYPEHLITPQALRLHRKQKHFKSLFYVNPNDKLDQNYYSPTAEAQAQICLTDCETGLRLCPSIYSIIQLIGAINWTPGEETQGSFCSRCCWHISWWFGMVGRPAEWRPTVFVHAGPGRRSATRGNDRWCLLVTDHSGSISDTGSVTG